MSLQTAIAALFVCGLIDIWAMRYDSCKKKRKPHPQDMYDSTTL